MYQRLGPVAPNKPRLRGGRSYSLQKFRRSLGGFAVHGGRRDRRRVERSVKPLSKFCVRWSLDTVGSGAWILNDSPTLGINADANCGSIHRADIVDR